MNLKRATQASLYKGIRRRKKQARQERRATKENLDIARHNVNSRTNSLPNDEQIWASVRNNAIHNKKAKQFLWKLIHGALLCGRFWEKMNNYENRSVCVPCNTLESPEHILTECEFSGQKTVWSIVNDLFGKKGIPWSRATIGAVLGCGISDLRTQHNTKRPGANRLYSTIVSEAAFFIWKIRCEWVIQNERDPNRVPSRREIQNRWTAVLNRTLKQDILAARYTQRKAHQRNQRESQDVELTIEKWWDVVTSNEDLFWEVKTGKKRKESGVLVGIG
jgi:hypothetical protein